MRSWQHLGAMLRPLTGMRNNSSSITLSSMAIQRRPDRMRHQLRVATQLITYRTSCRSWLDIGSECDTIGDSETDRLWVEEEEGCRI